MKKQKSIYKFNVIDLLLIIMIVAVLGAIYYFISGKTATEESSSDSKYDVNYVIELKMVDKDFVDKFQVGDKVTESIRSGYIGEIVDIEITPAWTITTDLETGEMTKTYYPPINLPVQDDVDIPSDENPEESLEGNEVTDETTAIEEDAQVTEGESEQAEVTPNEDTTVDSIENNVPAPEYDFYNIRLVVSAQMEYTGKSYAVDGFGIVVGHLLYFRTPQYVGSGYCVKIDVAEQEVQNNGK